MGETIRCRRLSFAVIPFPCGLINEGSRGDWGYSVSVIPREEGAS